MASVKVLLWIDVEDYITPESQDSLLALLQMLNKRNVKGIFKFVGEKARRVEEDGRADIVSELQRHEVGYHTDLHSQHPVTTEYLEFLGFRSGAEEYEARERQGLEDVRRITGKPAVCYGQAGYSWAPQTFAALNKWGIPVYLDDHDHVSWQEKPFWYGGLLNFTHLKGTMRMKLREGGLEEAKRQFDRLYDELSAEPAGFVSIYYHECDFVCSAFWDKENFGRGRQTPRELWKAAPLKPEGEMEFYLEQLGQFIDYTLSKENVEYIGSEQALALECSSRAPVGEDEVRALAASIGDELGFRVSGTHSLSPADLYSLFRCLLLGKELTPEFMYGPENEVESEASGPVRVSDVIRALDAEYPEVLGYKMLPDSFELNGGKISPLDLTCTMARILERGLSGDDEVEIVRGKLKTKECAGDNELWGTRWSIFPEDLRVPNVVRMSKLQTWTMKPAIFG